MCVAYSKVHVRIGAVAQGMSAVAGHSVSEHMQGNSTADSQKPKNEVFVAFQRCSIGFSVSGHRCVDRYPTFNLQSASCPV